MAFTTDRLRKAFRCHSVLKGTKINAVSCPPCVPAAFVILSEKKESINKL